MSERDVWFLHKLSRGMTIHIPHAVAYSLHHASRGLKSASPLTGGHFITLFARHLQIPTDQATGGYVIRPQHIPDPPETINQKMYVNCQIMSTKRGKPIPFTGREEREREPVGGDEDEEEQVDMGVDDQAGWQPSVWDQAAGFNQQWDQGASGSGTGGWHSTWAQTQNQGWDQTQNQGWGQAFDMRQGFRDLSKQVEDMNLGITQVLQTQHDAQATHDRKVDFYHAEQVAHNDWTHHQFQIQSQLSFQTPDTYRPTPHPQFPQFDPAVSEQSTPTYDPNAAYWATYHQPWNYNPQQGDRRD